MNMLEELRTQIDQLDKEIIEKIAERQNIVEKVSAFKLENNIQVFDAKREDYLEKYHIELSTKYNVSIEFIKELFKLIMDESKRIQNNTHRL